MTAYEFLHKAITDRQTVHPPQWKYRGPGYGQNIQHVIVSLTSHEVVTCSEGYGWLGSPTDFVKQFVT